MAGNTFSCTTPSTVILSLTRLSAAGVGSTSAEGVSCKRTVERKPLALDEW